MRLSIVKRVAEVWRRGKVGFRRCRPLGVMEIIAPSNFLDGFNSPIRTSPGRLRPVDRPLATRGTSTSTMIRRRQRLASVRDRVVSSG